MSIRNLQPLLAPRNIALIGASAEPGSVGQIVLERVMRGGFEGAIFAVNPHRLDIAGATWVATISDLPIATDLAVVMTPAATVPQLIGELGRRGVRLAVVLSAGVTGDAAWRSTVRDAARESGVTLIGPNCLGLLMPHAKLDASFAAASPKPGRLALISQSGALITAMLDWGAQRGIGFSGVVSVGDMIDADMGDLLDLFAIDSNTDAILLYVESIGDAAKFISAARAAARSKPVIAIKAGRSEAASRAALSHSGALAGSYKAYRAAFDRAGIVTVETLGELFDAAEVLSCAAPVRGERVAILTNGGGVGILALDAVQQYGGTVADLSPATIAALDAVLPPSWSRANPVDLIGDGGAERYRAAITALAHDDGVDAIMVMHCPTAMVLADEVAGAVVAALADAATGAAAKPVIACWLGSESVAAQAIFRAVSVPVFATPEDAARGLSFLFAARRVRSMLIEQMPRSTAPSFDGRAARRVMAGARADGRTLLSETEAKDVLSAFNIPVVPTHFAPKAEDVVDACAGLTPPFAVKIVSPDLPHKSDAGGVALSLAGPLTAADAARHMAERIAREQPQARLRGFAVQSMSTRAHAVELFVGVANDPTFGPVILFGAGGVAVHVVDDIALALPPFDRTQARELIAATRISRLLKGYRSRPPADEESLIDLLMGISRLVEQMPEIVELDVNPVLCGPDGVVALDARIVLAADPDAPSRLAIRPVPVEWATELVTRAGVKLRVRPAVPADEPLLADFFGQVTPDDLRFRFLSGIGSVDPAQIAAMTRVDYRRTISFLAIEPTGSVAATAMLAADPDLHRAEIAMSTRPDWKGRGVSYTLLQHVLRYAGAQGIAVVEAVEFADHEEALRMEREMGFTSLPCPDDPRLRIVRKNIVERPAC